MSFDGRLKRLESIKPSRTSAQAFTIRVINFREGSKEIPIDAFQLSIGASIEVLRRKSNEFQADFLIRATLIRDSRVTKPMSRCEVPPAPILLQLTRVANDN